MKTRYLEQLISDDLSAKMVFLSGPRQVGKTTLAHMASKRFARPAYFNWDNRDHRLAILHAQWAPESDLLIFDELHKYAKWKSWVKGVWDTRPPGLRILVTGSSRLDVFRRGGDSLLGRYHYYRLHPFSLAEVNAAGPLEASFPDKPPTLDLAGSGDGLDELLHFGGFPEPFLAGSERTLKRWQKERFERVFREDIRELETVRSLSQVELLGALMPTRVASPISTKALAEDVEASPKTVTAWLELLCRNYYAFKVPPYHKRIERALKRAAKYYLWDWSEVPDKGARFENMVAAHLLKFCHFNRDAFGLAVELFYVRDTDGREVDFLLTWEQRPWMLVECKLSAPNRLTSLNYFTRKLSVRGYLVALDPRANYEDRKTGLRVVPAHSFLRALV